MLSPQWMKKSGLSLSHIHSIHADPISPHATNDDVAALFVANPTWHALALVDAGRPIALVGRQQFVDRYAKQFFKEICGRKSCLAFANTSPTRIEDDCDVNDLVSVLTSQDQRYLGKPQKAVSLGPFKRSLARSPIVHDHAETASTISLKMLSTVHDGLKYATAHNESVPCSGKSGAEERFKRWQETRARGEHIPPVLGGDGGHGQGAQAAADRAADHHGALTGADRQPSPPA